MRKTGIHAARAMAASIALIMPLSFCVPAYADNTGELDVMVYYSDDITPEEGDTFVITYEDTDGNSDTLTFDAYDYSGSSYGVFQLAEDTYTVTDITYEGTSEEITGQGYGATNEFKIESGDYDILAVYIGESEVSSLKSEYLYAVVKEGGYSEDDPQVYEDRNGKYIIEEVDGEEVIVYLDDTVGTDTSESDEEGETYEGNGETGSSSEAESGQSSSQEPVTEYYGDEEDEDEGDGSPGITVVIIAVVALGGGAVLFAARKKGMI